MVGFGFPGQMPNKNHGSHHFILGELPFLMHQGAVATCRDGWPDGSVVGGLLGGAWCQRSRPSGVGRQRRPLIWRPVAAGDRHSCGPLRGGIQIIL